MEISVALGHSNHSCKDLAVMCDTKDNQQKNCEVTQDERLDMG